MSFLKRFTKDSKQSEIAETVESASMDELFILDEHTEYKIQYNHSVGEYRIVLKRPAEDWIPYLDYTRTSFSAYEWRTKYRPTAVGKLLELSDHEKRNDDDKNEELWVDDFDEA